jgi:hypothetical protein
MEVRSGYAYTKLPFVKTIKKFEMNKFDFNLEMVLYILFGIVSIVFFNDMDTCRYRTEMIRR